jgi:crossover junction endodeoxyribonuclease RuvC
MADTPSVRILGVDPGLRITGWAILVLTEGRVGTRTGAIRLPARAETPQRLRLIHEALLAVIDKHHPQAVAVERPFVKEDVRAAMALAHGQAAAFIAAAQRDLPVHEYAPREVKMAVTGDGHADKTVVAASLAMELGLESTPALLDESDALAIAYCHHLLTQNAVESSAQ